MAAILKKNLSNGLSESTKFGMVTQIDH